MAPIPAKTKKSAKERPELPLVHFNPLLKTIVDTAVKYQVIEREGQEIVVGRVKVPTPDNKHAFILRRFDTGAVSLTTMFRAAYPSATDEEEKADAAWIKSAYDVSGANGSYKGSGRQHLRLAGTWLPPDVALAVADAYTLSKIIYPLVEAEPDLDQHYKKSIKNGDDGSDGAAPTSPSMAERTLSPPVTKRRKASPGPVAVVPPLSPSAPATRRSVRSSKSPVPPSIGTAMNKVKSPGRKPPSRRGVAAVPTPPAELEDDVPSIGHVDADADIEESKRLVEDIKKSYSKKPKSKVAEKTALKRVMEEEAITFEPKEPEVGERAIVRGPARLRNLPPQRQAAAWGALVFAIGLGATAFLPNFL